MSDDKELGNDQAASPPAAESPEVSIELPAESASDGDADAPPVAPESADQPRPGRSLGGLVALLALAVAAVAVAGTGFLWWQYRQFYVALDGADLQQRETLESLVVGQAEFDALFDDLRRQLEQERERIVDLRTRVTDFPQQIGGLSRRLDALQGRSLDARDVWLRAEAEYYLVVANTELALSGRIENAIAALELADGLLRELGDPALNPARVAIADELTRLRAIPLIDAEGLAFSLASLESRVQDLPFRGGTAGSFADGEPELDAVEPGLDRLWESLKQAVGGLVRVERREQPVEVLLGTAGRSMVRRQLMLELQLARISLLRGEQEAFRASLLAAENLLGREFDAESAAVDGARELLAELGRLDISPDRPDISGSLGLLRSAGGGGD
jgi:uncharacterized protein HemX